MTEFALLDERVNDGHLVLHRPLAPRLVRSLARRGRPCQSGVVGRHVVGHLLMVVVSVRLLARRVEVGVLLSLLTEVERAVLVGRLLLLLRLQVVLVVTVLRVRIRLMVLRLKVVGGGLLRGDGLLR